MLFGFFFSVFQLWSLSTSCDLDCVLPTGSYWLWGSVKSAFQTFGTREHMTSTGPDSVHWLPFLKSALWLSHTSTSVRWSSPLSRGKEGGRGWETGGEGVTQGIHHQEEQKQKVIIMSSQVLPRTLNSQKVEHCPGHEEEDRSKS